jgi:hypothetical protein
MLLAAAKQNIGAVRIIRDPELLLSTTPPPRAPVDILRAFLRSRLRWRVSLSRPQFNSASLPQHSIPPRLRATLSFSRPGRRSHTSQRLERKTLPGPDSLNMDAKVRICFPSFLPLLLSLPLFGLSLLAQFTRLLTRPFPNVTMLLHVY